MKYFIPLILVPTFLCVSCAKSQVAVPAPPSAGLIVSGPDQPAAPQFAEAAQKPDMGPYQKPTVPGAIHLEAEEGTLTGNTVLTTRPGFSGKGYVGGFEKDGAKIAWTIPNVKPGIYRALLRYSAPFGNKSTDLAVNGKVISVALPGTGDKFADLSAGKVEMTAGTNTVEIRRGWGYYDVDALDFVPAQASGPPAKVSAALSDPLATPEARALMQTLVHFYGAKTLSGQVGAGDTAYIQSVTGKTPAIMAGDFIDYSPSRLAYGSDPKGETERVIKAAQSGQVVSMVWHWNAPSGLLNKMGTDAKGKPVNMMWYKGFYTNATTFDVQKALADPNSKDYALLLRDMDAIAVQLQKFSDAKVPVLWRPLHEGEGGWFWWGAKGPDAYKKLWRLMYQRFTVVHHLHNLIWVDCAGTDPAWYPGDDVVDVVGIDGYPSDVTDPLSTTWDTLQAQYAGRKLLALTEFGGVPDIAKMQRYGVYWAYFASWTGGDGPHKMSASDLTRLYQEPAVANKSDLAGR
jgi:mannan endo-1,4-beta-mannosidase